MINHRTKTIKFILPIYIRTQVLCHQKLVEISPEYTLRHNFTLRTLHTSVKNAQSVQKMYQGFDMVF